jgi:hypothetical protein
MTVLTIRAHKRYATRQKVRLSAGAGCPVDGLLIELSSEGCRISNLGQVTYEIGQSVCVELGEDVYRGRVRWSHDGLAGIRLDDALHCHEVASLLAQGRDVEPERRYGT